MRVVHYKKESYTHYIGRPGPFGNPYRTPPLTRARAIEAFERHARGNVELLWLIAALPADAVLGCWCPPLPCHGSVIVKLWREIHE